jgi:hypothetical protein
MHPQAAERVTGFWHGHNLAHIAGYWADAFGVDRAGLGDLYPVAGLEGTGREHCSLRCVTNSGNNEPDLCQPGDLGKSMTYHCEFATRRHLLRRERR